MKKNIVIVAHKFLPQMDDDLALYLNKRKYHVTHINHSFPDAKDRRSCLTEYKSGKISNEIKTLDYKFLPEIFIYLKELFFTFRWLRHSDKKFDLYIGMDGLCSLFGLMLRYFCLCRKVVYWSVDFVPINRFNNNWKSFIYHRINIFACKQADEVWDLSPRMAKGRAKYFNLGKLAYKSHKVVQNGIWLNRITNVPYSKCEKNTLVFMGHLMKKQGVQFIIKRIPEIIKKIPNFKFKIIGEGNYKKDLESLVNSKSVKKYCLFLGRLSNIDLENEISKSCVAIAPYILSRDSYTYYADPGKVKTYLACGVPLLLTDLPWNAHEIEKNKCGLVILDKGQNLVEKLTYIMQPKINIKFRKNAIEYSKTFDYEKIFLGLNI